MQDAFDQAFEFAREAMKRPELLDQLPDKSTLALRGIDVHGHPIQLTAAKAPGSDQWTALISRWSLTTTSPLFLRPILDARSVLHDQQAVMATFRESGNTSEAALDALERRVQAAITEAIHFDPEGDGG
jgi:hypothetical protein